MCSVWKLQRSYRDRMDCFKPEFATNEHVIPVVLQWYSLKRIGDLVYNDQDECVARIVDDGFCEFEYHEVCNEQL